MGINWGGFIKGVSDYGLERLKEERTLKMQEQLLELQDKWKEAAELREYERKKREVAGTRQSADDPTKVEDFNMEGTVLNTRARSARDLKEEEQNNRMFEANIENLSSQVQHRKDQINVERERIAALRERNKYGIDGLFSGAGSAGSSPETSLADALIASLQLGKTQTENGPLMAKYRILANDALYRANIAGRDIPERDRFNLALRLFLNNMSELDK